MPKKVSPKAHSDNPSLYKVLEWLRKITISVLLTVSCVGLIGFVAVRWIENQFLNSENWIAFVTPLPKQPVIYNALGSYITSQLFNPSTVQAEITDALPPKAAFLATPLTSQLNKLTENVAQKAVGSDAFQSVWVAANRIAINRILNGARNQPDTNSKTNKLNQAFSLDLSGGKGLIRQKLGSVAPALFQNNTNAPTKKINITVNLKVKQERLRAYIRAADFLNAVLPLLVIASLFSALALSHARRKLTIVFASLMAVLSLLQLIGVKVLRPEILNLIQNASYKPAVSYIYNSLVKTFNHEAYSVLAISVILLIICILAGKLNFTKRLWTFIKLDKIQSSPVLKYWRSARVWIGKYKYYIWIAVLALSLVYMAFIADLVVPRTITNSLFVLISLIAVTHILGTPPKRAPK